MPEEAMPDETMPDTRPREPIVLVNVPLLLWGNGLAVLTYPFFQQGRDWAPIGFTIAGLTIVLAVWGLATRRWVRPLFASLYILAIGCLVGGAIEGIDLWAGLGILSVTILSVGAAILHRLGQLR